MRKEIISNKMKIAASQNIKEKDYWLNRLAGDLVRSFFPYDCHGRASDERRPDTITYQLSDQLSAKLIKLSSKSDNRLHMIFTAGLTALLNKYTGNKDIIVGMPIYKQKVEGEFINTVLPIRNKLGKDMIFKGLLLQVRDTIAEASENQNYPMKTLLYKLNTPSSPTHSFPLFDAAILLENIHDKSYLKHINYNMLFSFCRTGESIEGTLEYNASLYEKVTGERIVNHYQQLLTATLSNPDITLTDIDILPKEEKQRILLDFNNTRREYPQDKTIHALLEARVEKAPDKIAVIYKDQYLTYGALNEKANRLAGLLRERGVNRDSIVPIIMEASLELISAIGGILKAGGAYLPIDPQYPERRIFNILRDSGASILLTGEKILKNMVFTSLKGVKEGNVTPVVTTGRPQIKDFDSLPLPDRTLINYEKYHQLKRVIREIVCLDDLEETAAPYPEENPHHVNHSGDLLYLISTSGSTGTPKSLMLEHGNMINLLNFDFFETGIPFKRLPQFSSIGFDMSSHEIFAALLTGGELYLIDSGLKQDVFGLLELMGKNHMNVVFWPPAFLKYVFSEPDYRDRFPQSIEHIITSGEQLIITEPIRRYLKEHRIHLHNHYGPAETHVVTAFTMAPPGEIPRIPPIGKPISNTAIFILDENKQIKPIGAVGELYISGANVGRGYLDRPELTAEKFKRAVIGHSSLVIGSTDKFSSNDRSPRLSLSPNDQCPMTNDRSHKLYRTGDLARWLPDGNIEFIGRADNQVKIRGFRIELAEIEQWLMRMDSIKEAVVVDLKDPAGEKFLCAYIVCPEQMELSNIKVLLARDLPDYMVPSYLLRLERIPLTPNGKIDKKALPQPGLKVDKVFVAPRDDMEEKMAMIWSEVLGIEKDVISIDADFFELGGHSLKATILITRIHKAFNIKLTIGEMFELPTIRGLSELIKEADHDIFTPIQLAEKKEYYPLSSAQKRIYIIQQMKFHNISYNNPTAAVLEGDLDQKKFQEKLRQLIERHETLRTSFEMIDNQVVQRVHEDVEFTVVYSEMTGEEVGKRVSMFMRPFDLSRAPLIRIELIKTGDERHVLMYDLHHIITDGTSMQVFVKEFMALYGGKQLQPLKTQYKDFSGWQNRLFESGEIRAQQEYWQKQFEGEIPILDIPTDYPRPPVMSSEGSFVNFQLKREETRALKKLAAQGNATLYMVLLSIFNVLLAKISGQEDIIIGTPIAARRHAELHFIIGMFVNTLVMRNYPAGQKNFSQFLKDVSRRTVEAFENQDYPFEQLVDQIEVKRDTSRNPLFDVMFTFQNMAVQSGNIPEVEIPGLKLFPFAHERKSGEGLLKVDLRLIAMETGDELKFGFAYGTRLFKNETIERLITYFRNIALDIIINAEKKISEIEIISVEEKNRLLFDFNRTESVYPKDKTIPQLFGEQAVKTPDNTAVVGVGTRLTASGSGKRPVHITYNQLNKQSNGLALLLREKGGVPDTIIGIMIERSIEMIVGILAILKAGGAYLPIDPDYPGERLNYMLADSGAKVMVTTALLAEEGEKVRRWEGEKIFLEPDYCSGRGEVSSPASHRFVLLASEIAPSASTSTLTSTCQMSPANLAYVIYTSGSSGQPKGVMVGHRNVTNLVTGLNERIYKRYSNPQRVTLVCHYGFDASIKQIFGALLLGHSLYIVPEDTRTDGDALLQYYKKHQIDISDGTPAHLLLLLESTKHNSLRVEVKQFIIGGEVLQRHLLKNFLQAFEPHPPIITNVYGPTECCVDTTSYDITVGNINHPGEIPIGRPMPNYRVYILDRALHLQPVSAAGELCIAGAGVARGYLNRPELTAEKFCLRRPGGRRLAHSALRTADPWTPRKNFSLTGSHKDHMQSCNHATMQLSPHHLPHYPITPLPHHPIYMTGDLAKWQRNGYIQFLGRIDHQVKIRGFRIELGEIESQLLRHKHIKDTVIIVKETDNAPPGKDSDRHLVAYIVPKKDIQITELREYLSRELPEYMIPSHFVQLDKIPLTPNGKVNSKALPQPEKATGESYIAPRDELESRLADIWGEILMLPVPIGIDDNFFHMGGHSLKAVILASKIHNVFHVKIPLAEIFSSPTIRGLAKFIRKTAPGKHISIEPVEAKEYYAMSSAQKRLYFIQQLQPESTSYNHPIIKVLTDTLDRIRLEDIFRQLIKRHDSFRTSFELIGDEVVQKIHQNVGFDIQYYDLTTASMEKGRTEEGKGRRVEKKEPFRQINAGGGDLAAEDSESTVKKPFDPKSQKLKAKSYIYSFIRPFDLSHAPLLRVGLISVAKEEHILLIDLHHIITDGISQNILLREFMLLSENNGVDLPPLRLQYRDYAQWQTSEEQRESLKKQEKYWLDQLCGELPILQLPLDYPRSTRQSFEGKRLRFQLEQDAHLLKEMSKNRSTTIFVILLAAFYVLLYKLSGQDDIIIGTVTAGRNHTDLDRIVGMFANTLALRNYPSSNKTFLEFLKELSENTIEAFDNQQYQYDELVQKIISPEKRNRNPIFDVVFVLENQYSLPGDTTAPGSDEVRDSSQNSYEFDHPITHFDLLLVGYEVNRKLVFNFEYCTRLFKVETIHSFITYYKKIISSILKYPGQKLKDIEILNKEEKNQLLKKLKSEKKNLFNTESAPIETKPEDALVDFDF